MATSPHGINYSAYRPVVMGRRGVVSSSHYLASQAGLRTLQAGGNAVDAAIAVASSLNVVEPEMSGIGGDGFMLVYMAKTGKVEALNGTGAAPLSASIDRFRDTGIPPKGQGPEDVRAAHKHSRNPRRMAGGARAIRRPVAGQGVGAGHRACFRRISREPPAGEYLLGPARGARGPS